MKFILADIEAVRRYIADIEAGNWIDFFGEGAEAVLKFENARLAELLALKTEAEAELK